jgi:hypothetical protein
MGLHGVCARTIIRQLWSSTIRRQTGALSSSYSLFSAACRVSTATLLYLLLDMSHYVGAESISKDSSQTMHKTSPRASLILTPFASQFACSAGWTPCDVTFPAVSTYRYTIIALALSISAYSLPISPIPEVAMFPCFSRSPLFHDMLSQNLYTAFLHHLLRSPVTLTIDSLVPELRSPKSFDRRMKHRKGN